MSDKVKISTIEFENVLSSIEEKVHDIKGLFGEINKEMSNVDGTHNTIWSSSAQDKLYKHYTSISDKFPNIESRLEEYVKFLKNTLDLYKKEENIQEISVDNQDDNLDII